jgi:DNA-binding transcriptional MerR regulator
VYDVKRDKLKKMSFSIKSLAEDTGETIRSLQNWCDLGVLIAEPSTERKGRGYHRVFADGERKWALLAAALNKLRVPLGDIAKYLKYLRESYRKNFERSGGSIVDRILATSPMVQALNNSDKGDVFIMLSLRPKGDSLQVKMKLFPPIDTETDDPILKDACKSMCLGTVKNILEFSRENPESHFLNLTQIWAPLRRPE